MSVANPNDGAYDVATMECVQQGRLLKALRTAGRELVWALDEQTRLLSEGNLNAASTLERTIRNDDVRRRTAIRAYRRHIQAHGCISDSAAS